jgi:hypothetical protein
MPKDEAQSRAEYLFLGFTKVYIGKFEIWFHLIFSLVSGLLRLKVGRSPNW